MKDILIHSLYSDEVVTASPSTPIAELEKLMKDFLISHIPIVDESNMLIGMVSKTDIFKAYWEMHSSSGVLHVRDFLQMPASDIMSIQVVLLKYNSTIHQAADILTKNELHSLPVVDENNKVVGILTGNDLLIHMMKSYG